MAAWLTQADVNQYGPDLIDVAQRSALHALSPHLQQIQDDNHLLRQRLAVEARHRLDAQVERALPHYREIDRDPRWHQWLLTQDPLSGRVRQDLLDEAISQAQPSRVISFFKQFENQAAVQASYYGASPSAHGRARTSVNGPIYSRAQIAKLFDQHRRGEYAGRPEEWNRIERDIIAAGRENRIYGGMDPRGGK